MPACLPACLLPTWLVGCEMKQETKNWKKCTLKRLVTRKKKERKQYLKYFAVIYAPRRIWFGFSKQLWAAGKQPINYTDMVRWKFTEDLNCTKDPSHPIRILHYIRTYLTSCKRRKDSTTRMLSKFSSLSNLGQLTCYICTIQGRKKAQKLLTGLWYMGVWYNLV